MNFQPKVKLQETKKNSPTPSIFLRTHNNQWKIWIITQLFPLVNIIVSTPVRVKEKYYNNWWSNRQTVETEKIKKQYGLGGEDPVIPNLNRFFPIFGLRF